MVAAAAIGTLAEADRATSHVPAAFATALVGVVSGALARRFLLLLAAAPRPRQADRRGSVLTRRGFLVAAGSLTALAVLPVVLGRSLARGLRAATARARVVLPTPVRPLPPPAAATA